MLCLSDGRFSKQSDDLAQMQRTLLLRCQTTNDVLPGDDADKAVQIVDHRDEIVAGDVLQKLVERGRNPHGGILPKDIPDVEPLQLLHGAGTGRTLVGKEPPEEVSLADGAHILSLAVDDGDGAAAMVPELLQPLAHRVVVVKESDFVLGNKQIGNVHGSTSFLNKDEGPPGS